MAAPADVETGALAPQESGEDEHELQMADVAFSEEDNKRHDPFQLSVAELCKLNQLGQDAECLKALQEFGGQEGLLAKLQTHMEDGVAAASVAQRAAV